MTYPQPGEPLPDAFTDDLIALSEVTRALAVGAPHLGWVTDFARALDIAAEAAVSEEIDRQTGRGAS